MCHRVTQAMYISMNRAVIPFLVYLKETFDLIYLMQKWTRKNIQFEVISSDLITITRKCVN